MYCTANSILYELPNAQIRTSGAGQMQTMTDVVIMALTQCRYIEKVS